MADGAHGLPDERIQTSIDLVAVGPGSDGVLLSRTRGHTGLPMISAERVGDMEMVTPGMLQHLGGSSIPHPWSYPRAPLFSSISHLAWELDISQNMRHAVRFHDRAHWMNHMKQAIAINSLLTETATQANTILGVEVTTTTILVQLQPTLAPAYQRPDCQQPVVAAYHDSELLTVQGLGVPGKAVRYQVKSIRLGYLNDAGTFTTFTVPIPG